ncbi:MAG: DUF58 domain-containing protein [Planctomycetota bacterium]
MTKQLKYLDPNLLKRLESLQIKAKYLMQGLVAGMHRSVRKGFSVEFAQHREYSIGDDLRYLDWKVFGKTERLYIKEYEQETNLDFYILLDVSKSMLYDTTGKTKLELAYFLLCAVAYLVIAQRDAVGFGMFDTRCHFVLPPSTSDSQLRYLNFELESIVPKEKTTIKGVFESVAERIRRRSMIMIVSDFLCNLKELKIGLGALFSGKHDVILAHILHHDELNFDFNRTILFDSLEELLRLKVDAKSIRKAYLEVVKEQLTAMRSLTLKFGMDYALFDTAGDLEKELFSFLASRLAQRVIMRKQV